MRGQVDTRSDRLNDEVALFAGCTLRETMAVIFISLLIGLVAGMPVTTLLCGKVTLGLAVSLMIMAIAFLPLLMALSRFKRGKPPGYYRQRLRMAAARVGLAGKHWVVRSGKWSTPRWRK